MSRVQEQLCSLSYADRAVKCSEMRQHPLPPDELAEVCYFEAQAMYELGRLNDSEARLRDGLGATATPVLRAMLLSGLASTALDLGRLDETRRALDEIAAIDLSGDPKEGAVRSHNAMVMALLFQAEKAGAALELFVVAASEYERLGNEHGASWAYVNAGSAALRNGNPLQAQELLSRVRHTKYAPAARLLEAEVHSQGGDYATADRLIAEVLDGCHGEIRHRHVSRANYLHALREFAAGNFIQAGVFLTVAQDELELEGRKELDLLNDITALRAKLAVRREVA